MRTISNLVILMALLVCNASAQVQIPAKATLPLEITVFDNATLLPGGGALGVLGIPVHPGFSAGTEWRYNHHPKNIWYQTGRLAYHYHKYVQHSVQAYSELGYRRRINHFDAGLRIGAGYLHAIPANEIFKLNDQGRYERLRSIGRPQFMASAAVALGFRVAGSAEAPVRLVLAYQFYLQMPFSPGYVPLVPNTALHLGFSFPCFKR